VQKLILNSYAKLNLGLIVRSKRKDGYHNLETLFERISLADKIILKFRRDNCIRIICNDPQVPQDQRNLAYKAALLLQDRFQVDKGVDIRIVKRIPVGAGLGGGSSNAATVFLGLNKLWELNLSLKVLAKLAGEIGSDVAFFIYKCSFAQGLGRGERIKPLENLENLRFWHILVAPKLHVATPLVYNQWDRLSPRLTRAHLDVKILHLCLKGAGVSLISKLLVNDLEKATFKLYPAVERIKKYFIRLGLENCLMSGSGSSVFAIVGSKKEGLVLRKNIVKKNKSWRVYLAETV